MRVTPDELFEELRRLNGKFVAVSFHPTAEWAGSVLHAQGRLGEDVVDPPEGGIAFGIRRPRRLSGDWAEVEIMSYDVESAVWRRNLPEHGPPLLAITMRGGAFLAIGVP